MIKRTFLLTLVIIAINLYADDFVKEVGTTTTNHYVYWCCFTNTKHDLLVNFERTNPTSCTFSIIDSNFLIQKQFRIDGLQDNDVIIPLVSRGNLDCNNNCLVTQYFFNDDDNYEVIVGKPCYTDYYYYGGDPCTDIRVLNDKGELLGTLDFIWSGEYISIGEKHYLLKEEDDKYIVYSITNQTGTPIKDAQYDVNNDSRINVSDVTALINRILGIQ